MALSLVSLLFPPRCPCCGEKREQKEVLCKACLALYQKQKYSYCEGCGKRRCRCSCRPAVASGAVLSYLSVFRYRENSPGGRLILKIKARQDKQISRFLAQDLAGALQNGCILEQGALITYVPRRKGSVLQSGTDQAMDLALELGERVNLPVVPLLERTKQDRVAQKELSAKDRQEHARRIYLPKKDAPDLTGRQVILVDDVLTTGATMFVCAEHLKDLGARQVVCLCVGRR